MNYHILVTGSNGYIARSILKLIPKKNYKLILLDKKNSKSISNNYLFYKGDFSNKKILDKVFSNKIDLIIHLAAFIDVSASIKYPAKYLNNNYHKTVKLFEYCLSKNMKNIIFASSAAVYGRIKQTNLIKETSKVLPDNAYGLSKLKVENYLKKKKKFNFISLRLFNITGYNELYNEKNFLKRKNSIFDKILKHIYKKKKLFIFGKKHQTKDGYTVRDFIHVDDLANIILDLINKFKKNKKFNSIINCGSGRGNSILELIKTFEKIYDIQLKYTVKSNIKGNISNVVSNNEKLKNLINYKLKKSNIDFIIKEFKKKFKNKNQ